MRANGELPEQTASNEHIENLDLVPEDLAAQIVHAINQPRGVNISEITVRASGDRFIL